MKCPNCGRDNEDGGKFCKYCGCPLNAEYPPPYYSINMNPPESEKKRKFKARLRARRFAVRFFVRIRTLCLGGYVISSYPAVFVDLSGFTQAGGQKQSRHSKRKHCFELFFHFYNNTLISFLRRFTTIQFLFYHTNPPVSSNNGAAGKRTKIKNFTKTLMKDLPSDLLQSYYGFGIIYYEKLFSIRIIQKLSNSGGQICQLTIPLLF